MRNASFSLITLLFISYSISAQDSGIIFKRVKPSQSLRDYNIAYLGDNPVVSSRSHYEIKKTDYVHLNYIMHLFENDYLTIDSLLSANEIANQQNWHAELLTRRSKPMTEEDKQMQFSYEFDRKLRELLVFNLSPELRDRFLPINAGRRGGKFTTWGGSSDEFQIKKAYEDFLNSNSLSKVKKDLNDFEISKDLIYVASGVVGNYDFNEKKLHLLISTERILYTEPIKQNSGGSLDCAVEINEEEAQAIKEKKFFTALIPVKPRELDVPTMKRFLEEPISERGFFTELRGHDIEIFDRRNANEKIITFNAMTCATR